MAFQNCALETAKESAVPERRSVGKFPADQEMVRSLVGKTTDDCGASNTDSVESSLLMESVGIAAEIVGCWSDFLRIRLSHRSVCASTMMSRY